MKLLSLALGVSVLFALWQWFRPYAWGPDSAARFTVNQCLLERDHSNLWLKVFLKPRQGQVMDLTLPVRLVTAGGKQHEMAEMVQVGANESGPAAQGSEKAPMPGELPDKVEQVVFSFWLSEADFAGPMKLELNGASLEIRDGDTLPKVAEGGFRVFNSSGW